MPDGTDVAGDNVASAPPSVPASLNAVVLAPATYGTNGSFSTLIQWQLSSPSPQGGIVVQEVQINVSGTLDDGSPLETNYHYWEAWPVAPNNTKTNASFNGYQYDDRLGGNGEPEGSTGTVIIDATARFYEGQSLPEDFIVGNPDTVAHDLPSTIKDPKLPTNNATPPVERHFSYKW